jgi:hypothetical protein
MQNTHLEHPEDTILTGDLSVLDWFVNPGKLSVKIDGSPAIVWGIDPACGKFFVGTKAVFNKKRFVLPTIMRRLMRSIRVKLPKFCTRALTICPVLSLSFRVTLSGLVV